MGRTAKTQRLTALAIKRYAQDPDATAPLHDGGGLYLRKRGAALHWLLRLTDPGNGAQQWHRLFANDPAGVYPHKSLGDARNEARRLWSIRSGGVDPRSERRRQIESARAELEEARLAAERRITLRQLFDRWAQIDLAPRITADGRRLGRKDAGAFTLAQFERRVFPKLGTIAVEDVRRGDLLGVLDAVKAEGKLRTANVLLSDLKQMYRFALTRELVLRNPLDTVSKRDVGGAPVERERVLSADELRMLDKVLPESGLQERFVRGLWLILATGVRVSELIGAVWVESARTLDDLNVMAEARHVKLGVVDVERRTWHLTQTKNQRDHTIHLSAFALRQFDALAALREADPDSSGCAVPWVFPNLAGDGPVNVKSLGKQLSDRQRKPGRRLKGRTKASSALVLPGGRWTAHDLRRTAATLMAAAGVSGDVSDECLNHMIESRVRRIYVRDRRKAAQARAFESLGAILEAIGNTPTVQSRPARRSPSTENDPSLNDHFANEHWKDQSVPS